MVVRSADAAAPVFDEMVLRMYEPAISRALGSVCSPTHPGRRRGSRLTDDPHGEGIYMK